MLVYCFYVEPLYDSVIKEYRHIVTINREPEGVLKNYVKRISMSKLSSFKEFGGSGSGGSCSMCVYAIKNIDTILDGGRLGGCDYGSYGSYGSYGAYGDLLSLDNIDNFIMFLIENNYTINKDITKLMNNDKIYLNNGKKLLFYVNYNN